MAPEARGRLKVSTFETGQKKNTLINDVAKSIRTLEH